MEQKDYRSYQYINGIVGETYITFPTERPFPRDIQNMLVPYSCNSAFLNASLPGYLCYFPLIKNKQIILVLSQTDDKTKSASVGFNAQAVGWEWENEATKSETASLNSMLLKRFDEILNTGFYTEDELDDLAKEGKPVPFCNRPRNAAETANFVVESRALRAVYYGVMLSWIRGDKAVTIAVPDGVDYNAYALQAVRYIYSYFPTALRVHAGFCTYLPKERAAAMPLVLIGFVPQSQADANAISLDGSSVPAINRLTKGTGLENLDKFIEYICSLDTEERAAFLANVNEETEGSGDPNIISGISGTKYAYYGDALRLLQLHGTAEELLPEWLKFYQLQKKYPRGLGKQIRAVVKSRLDAELVGKTVQEACKSVTDPEAVLGKAREYNALCADSGDWSEAAWISVRDAMEPLLTGGTRQFAELLRKNISGLENIVTEERIRTVRSRYDEVFDLLAEIPDYFDSLTALAKEGGTLKEEEVQNLRKELLAKRPNEYAAYHAALEAFLKTSITAKALAKQPPVAAKAILEDLASFDGGVLPVDISNKSFTEIRTAVTETNALLRQLGSDMKVRYGRTWQAKEGEQRKELPPEELNAIVNYLPGKPLGGDGVREVLRTLMNSKAFSGHDVPLLCAMLCANGYLENEQTAMKIVRAVIVGTFPNASEEDIFHALEEIRKNALRGMPEDAFVGKINKLVSDKPNECTAEARNVLDAWKKRIAAGEEAAKQKQRADSQEKRANEAVKKQEETERRLKSAESKLKSVSSNGGGKKKSSPVLPIILGTLCAVFLGGAIFFFITGKNTAADDQKTISALQEENRVAAAQAAEQLGACESGLLLVKDMDALTVEFSSIMLNEANRDFFMKQIPSYFGTWTEVWAANEPADITNQLATILDRANNIADTYNADVTADVAAFFWRCLLSADADGVLSEDVWNQYANVKDMDLTTLYNALYTAPAAEPTPETTLEPTAAPETESGETAEPAVDESGNVIEEVPTEETETAVSDAPVETEPTYTVDPTTGETIEGETEPLTPLFTSSEIDSIAKLTLRQLYADMEEELTGAAQ